MLVAGETMLICYEAWYLTQKLKKRIVFLYFNLKGNYQVNQTTAFFCPVILGRLFADQKRRRDQLLAILRHLQMESYI